MMTKQSPQTTMTNRIGGLFADFGITQDEPRKTQPYPIFYLTESPVRAAELLRFRFRLSRLETTVDSHAERIEKLELSLHPAAPHAGDVRDGDPSLMDVSLVTSELFPGNSLSIEVERDPWGDEKPYVVVNVVVDGNIDEILEKQMQWHDRIEQLPRRNSGQLRLNIIRKK